MAASTLTVETLAAALTGAAAAPHWWLAYSGGLDSTVLLHLLAQARRLDPALPPLTALHVHHQLQPGADAWQAHCARQCEALGVTLHCARVAVQGEGSGIEAAAREARHAAFAAQLGAGDVLMTAHHQDDQVETFFLRLLRGAGVEGLGAMAATRTLGQGSLYRPLLDWSRRQLQEYATAHALAYVEDPSNRDTNLDRNYLRAKVLPLLAERWPGYRATVARATLEQRSAAARLAEQLPPLPLLQNRFGDPGLELAPLLQEDEAVAAQCLRHWLRQHGLRAPDRARLLEFLRQLRTAAPDREPELTIDGVVLQRFRNGLYRLPPAADWQAAEGLTLAPDTSLEHPALGRLSLRPAPPGEPGLLLAAGERLELCFRRGGERCRPQGREGSHSLKKLLQEAGVPPWWRQCLPLLYRGTALLAVADCWYCDEPAAAGECDNRKRWQVRWERNSPAAAD